MKNKKSLTLFQAVFSPKYAIPGLVILLILLSLAWSLPRPGNIHLQKINPTPTATLLPGEPTPYPDEMLQNREQTNEIVFVGVILVLIIVVSTFVVINQKN